MGWLVLLLAWLMMVAAAHAAACILRVVQLEKEAGEALGWLGWIEPVGTCAVFVWTLAVALWLSFA